MKKGRGKGGGGGRGIITPSDSSTKAEMTCLPQRANLFERYSWRMNSCIFRRVIHQDATSRQVDG